MNDNLGIYMENYLYLSAPNFVMDEKKLYFSNRSCNALVIVDRETWNVESMVPFVEEELEAKELHMACCRQGNKIYFLPQGKKKLHVYDIESREQSAYVLEGEYEGAPFAPWHFHVWKDKVYLLPCGGTMGLWSLGFDGQLCRESWWELQCGADRFLHGSTDEAHFFSLRIGTREFTITDLEDRQTNTYQLPDEQVIRVAYDGQDFWYVSWGNADIVRWNPECGERERFSFPMWDKCYPPERPYSYIYAIGQAVFVVSGAKDELFSLDKEERVLKPVFQLPEFPRIYKEIDLRPMLTHIEDKLVWTFWGARGVAVIDLNSMEGKMYQEMFPLNEKVRDYFDKILYQNSPLIFEYSDGWDLEKFLCYCEKMTAAE